MFIHTFLLYMCGVERVKMLLALLSVCVCVCVCVCAVGGVLWGCVHLWCVLCAFNVRW